MKLLVVLICVLLIGLAVAFAQNPVIETRKYLNQETERIHEKAKGIAEELKKQMVPIVISTQEISAGEVIQAEMLETVMIHKKIEGSFTAPEQVIGKRAIVDIKKVVPIEAKNIE